MNIVKTCRGDDCNIKYHFLAYINDNGKLPYDSYAKPSSEPLVHLMSNGWKMDY